MEISRFVTKEQRAVLAKARETYGYTNQILVSTEELCELAAVCAKYPRYGTAEAAQIALHDNVIDEVADTLIILDHIINIFGLTPADIGGRVEKKVARLDRWLHTSSNIQQTTVDRCVELEDLNKGLPTCGSCKHYGSFENLKMGHVCSDCRLKGGKANWKPKEELVDEIK